MSRLLLAFAFSTSALLGSARAQELEAPAEAPPRRSASATPEFAAPSKWMPALAFWKPELHRALRHGVDADRGPAHVPLAPLAGSTSIAPEGHLVPASWSPPAPARAALSEAGLASPEPLILIVAGVAILGLVFLARRRPA